MRGESARAAPVSYTSRHGSIMNAAPPARPDEAFLRQLRGWVNDEVIQTRSQLSAARAFQQREGFGLVHFRHFLSSEVAAIAERQVRTLTFEEKRYRGPDLAYDSRFCVAPVWVAGQDAPPGWKALVDLYRSDAFCHLISAIAGESLRCHHLYVNALQVGHFLGIHADGPRELPRGCRISCILNLTKGWDKSWGGNLKVASGLAVSRQQFWNHHRTIAAEFNSFSILELTEGSLHAVTRVRSAARRRRRFTLIARYVTA